jgi:hypothetical protein
MEGIQRSLDEESEEGMYLSSFDDQFENEQLPAPPAGYPFQEDKNNHSIHSSLESDDTDPVRINIYFVFWIFSLYLEYFSYFLSSFRLPKQAERKMMMERANENALHSGLIRSMYDHPVVVSAVTNTSPAVATTALMTNNEDN